LKLLERNGDSSEGEGDFAIVIIFSLPSSLIEITMIFNILVALCLIFALCQARTGVDLSVPTTLSTWQCLVSQHQVDYSIIRVYRNIGQVDANAANSLKMAYQAGVKDLGGYLFPCMPTSPYTASKNVTCDSAKDQVLTTLRNLEQNGIFVKREGLEQPADLPKDAVFLNRLWLDIEDEVPAKYYDAAPAANQAFIADMVDTMNKLRIPVGIYSTKTYWNNIMGNIEGYSQYPLWYPRYDAVNSMDFFSPFAGWNEAKIKQTGGDIGWCSISQVDPDYMLDQ
jgi:hypothetical protein